MDEGQGNQQESKFQRINATVMEIAASILEGLKRDLDGSELLDFKDYHLAGRTLAAVSLMALQGLRGQSLSRDLMADETDKPLTGWAAIGEKMYREVMLERDREYLIKQLVKEGKSQQELESNMHHIRRGEMNTDGEWIEDGLSEPQGEEHGFLNPDPCDTCNEPSCKGCPHEDEYDEES